MASFSNIPFNWLVLKISETIDIHGPQLKKVLNSITLCKPSIMNHFSLQLLNLNSLNKIV